jgi:hypothetical protein
MTEKKEDYWKIHGQLHIKLQYCIIISNVYIFSTKAMTQMLGRPRGCYILSLARLLASSQYASRRSCDRLSRHRFSWFSSVFKQRLRWFPISKLLLHASHAALTL